jgi:biotin carboxylase
MPEVLMIGVGRMGRPYIAAARRLGLGVRAVEFGQRAQAVLGLADEVHVARGGFDELVVEGACLAATGQPPDAVVAFSEEHVMGAALLQDALGLPGPSLHASVVSRNKAFQRAVFQARGLTQPEYLVTEDLRTAEHWVASRLPVVVKPLSYTGSIGVEFVPDTFAFRTIAERRAGEGRLLVESAVDGPEYSWEAIVREGEIWFANITEKETTGPPHFVEVAHRTSAPVDAGVARQIYRLAAGVLSALRFRTGLVHLEFRLGPAGPTIMEVAVRTPGDFIMDIIGLSYGFDPFEIVLRLALRLPLPDPPAGPRRCAASVLLVAPPGRVTAIEGLDAVSRHPAVRQAEVKVAEGDMVGSTRSSVDRIGSAVLVADDRARLDDALEFVRRTLRVRTESSLTDGGAAQPPSSASLPRLGPAVATKGRDL